MSSKWKRCFGTIRCDWWVR